MVLLNTSILWNMMPCRLIYWYAASVFEELAASIYRVAINEFTAVLLKAASSTDTYK
jgi:hypothetical protein